MDVADKVNFAVDSHKRCFDHFTVYLKIKAARDFLVKKLVKIKTSRTN